ncbi:MAG: ORF6N domain-containing protein [Sphingobacteriales bacterium]|nr:ORF6N domain-containing protein [Sphingobacteriales bacterium]
MAKKELQALVAEQKILNKIYAIRGEKVMLDKDLAEMYGVETRVLNQSIKRNLNRFPKVFMFQLSEKEFKKHDITKCDIKLGRYKKIALCFYRAGSGHVIK